MSKNLTKKELLSLLGQWKEMLGDDGYKEWDRDEDYPDEQAYHQLQKMIRRWDKVSKKAWQYDEFCK